MKISNEVIAVLSECTVEGNILYLPPTQLERPLYTAVNKCLTNIGGKWNRSKKGHIFDYDPGDALDTLIITRETVDHKKLFQFFPTPRKVAVQMCELAELTPHSRVLEPSCGEGDLADVIHEQGVEYMIGIELDKGKERYLADKPYTTMTGIDFLEFAKDEGAKRDWTRIIMNPPFSKQQDIDHIMAAFGILGDDGVLVSVVSVSPFFRQNKKSVEFRDWLDANGAEVIDVPAGAFKASGTMVETKIIKIVKGGCGDEAVCQPYKRGVNLFVASGICLGGKPTMKINVHDNPELLEVL
jgi:hypothetical protein